MAKIETRTKEPLPNRSGKSRETSQDSSRLQSKKHSTSSTNLKAPRSSLPRYQKPWQRKVKVLANTADSSEFQRIYSLLSQLHRRNKNQHRGQRWWKFLELLRKNVGVLVQVEMELGAVETGNEGEQIKAEDVRKRLERSGQLDRRKGEVASWIRGVLLPKCYVAFSSVVQDGQFAALGLTLLGILARLGKLVGLPAVEIERVLGVSVRQTGLARGKRIEREYESPGPGADLDFGEVIERVVARDDEIRTVEGRSGQRSSEEAGTTRSTSAASDLRTAKQRESVASRTHQKKRKKSAIDDLFAELV